jgi:CheY-like chemotaxis protein
MTVLELATRWAEPPRILVVEDDRGSAKAVTDLLSRYLCSIDLVTTLGEALNAIMLNTYALAFVEMAMAEGSGLDVVKAIKAHAPATPVLVLTSAVERQAIEEIIDCGPVTVVRKPHDLTARQLSNTLAMFKVHATPREAASATAEPPCY